MKQSKKELKKTAAMGCPKVGEIILDLTVSKIHGRRMYAVVLSTEATKDGFSFLATNAAYLLHYPHRFFDFERWETWVK
jgi:hypothetical protein